MSIVFKDRVKETTTTTGTGALTLDGAVTGYQSFASVVDGNQCHYCIEAVDLNGAPSGDWEVGIGTYTASGTTLARTTVLASSNSGSVVNLQAGTKNVFLVVSASVITAFDLINVTAAIAAHEAEADPHTQYLTEAEGDAAYDALGAAAAAQAAAAADLAAHVADGDPHPQYLTQAEGDGLYDALGAAAAAQAASQPLDATLTAFAALTIAANSLTVGTGADAFSQVSFAANTFPARASTGDLVAKTITDFGLSLVDDADAAAARTTLGLGTAALSDTGDFDAAGSAAAAYLSATADLAAHVAALDPHSQYLTEAEADALYEPLGGGGGVSDGDKGDITVSGTGTTWTIDNNAVTLAKMADLANKTLIGRNTSGTGDPEAITLTQLLDWSGASGGNDILRRDVSGTWIYLDGTGIAHASLELASSVMQWSIKGTIILEDQKASGTNGGSSTSGSWQTRTLNTEVTDTNGDCTLASNQFTLVAGTYEIEASAPAYDSSFHQIRLANITDTTYTYGTSEFNVVNAQTRSFVNARFTIASSKVFEIQHRVGTSEATLGYGTANSFGGTEVYTQVFIRRVA